MTTQAANQNRMNGISEMDHIGTRIKTLADLYRAEEADKSVVCPLSKWGLKPKKAESMMALPGCLIYRLMCLGMYVYRPKQKQQKGAQQS